MMRRASVRDVVIDGGCSRNPSQTQRAIARLNARDLRPLPDRVLGRYRLRGSGISRQATAPDQSACSARSRRERSSSRRAWDLRWDVCKSGNSRDRPHFFFVGFGSVLATGLDSVAAGLDSDFVSGLLSLFVSAFPSLLPDSALALSLYPASR